MKKLMEVFRPFVAALPRTDYLWSQKWGCWVWVRWGQYENGPRYLECAEDALCSLVADAFDAAPGNTATETADNALAALRPYLAQLQPEQAEYAELELKAYRTLDEVPTP